MRLLLNLVKPKYFLPVHGELRHLNEHARLAMQCGVPEDRIFVLENGMVLEIDKHGIRQAERVPGGYVFVDGSGVGDVGRAVIRDREALARDGFIVVSINVDKRSGRMVGEPEIISRGFVYLRDSEHLIRQVKSTVSDVLSNGASKNGRRRERIEDNLSRMLYNETRRRPMVFTIVNEL
jgi:ribonuclease J